MQPLKLEKSIFYAFFFYFCASFVSIADAVETCPDLTQDMFCAGLSNGEVCEGWRVLSGTVRDGSDFTQVLIRSSFPYTVTCQYDKGRLCLVKQARAVPTLPYLWCYYAAGGCTFQVCNAQLDRCSFTLN